MFLRIFQPHMFKFVGTVAISTLAYHIFAINRRSTVAAVLSFVSICAIRNNLNVSTNYVTIYDDYK